MANVKRRVSRFSVDVRESCFVQLVSRGESEAWKIHRNVFSEKIEMGKRKVLIEELELD